MELSHKGKRESYLAVRGYFGDEFIRLARLLAAVEGAKQATSKIIARCEKAGILGPDKGVTAGMLNDIYNAMLWMTATNQN